jgi:phosphopentomutase
MVRRFIYVVLDGVGIGALPDAADYGDEGSDTLGNLSRVTPLHLPFLGSLGLGNIAAIDGVPPVETPLALVGRLAPASVGKDSTSGHWEQMGLVTARPFPTYPDGFPPSVIDQFTAAIGRGILGNRTASGTEIICTLGDEHLASGRPIVYTSADSVFQIAAHVDIVPLELLYSWCRAARELLVGEHAVARVIARPFTGPSGDYVRTADRRDYSLPPPGPTYMQRLVDAGVQVVALGKISELFAGLGVTSSAKLDSNAENLAFLAEMVAQRAAWSQRHETLIITNLVDFDTVWGHRNDADGFAHGLEDMDAALGAIAASLGQEELLLITSDHGVDPTTKSTDHSREYAPVLLYPRPVVGQPDAAYEGGFADAGATAFEYLAGRPADLQGRSLLALRPCRGWRRYTPVQSQRTGTVAGRPGRVGPKEAEAAVRWLSDNLGPAPEAAVILGSGLSVAGLTEPEAEVCYRAIPGWLAGDVRGHSYILTVVSFNGKRLAALRGRVHEYEGFDLSEVQLPIRSLAGWGVRRVLLTSAAGAVEQGLSTGDVMLVDQVLDLQYRDSQNRPVALEATAPPLLRALASRRPQGGPRTGSHASVPGPQYETQSELELLKEMGVATVSMTPAAELRAAHDEGMEVAVVTLVSNVGETTHYEVLTATERAGEAVSVALRNLLEVWA